MLYVGELAAIITSLTYAINSALFTEAGRKVGSLIVNRFRLIAACLLLMLAHWLFLGSPWPLQAEFFRWFWLGISGIAGLVLGDAFLFQAFVLVGPRIAMVMMSLAPILAAFSAWIFLDEVLGLWQIIGILVTLLGVIWVVMETNRKHQADQQKYIKGILFGLGGAAGQAMGLVLAKNGLEGGFSPLSANFMRMSTAAVVLWGLTVIQKEVIPSVKKIAANPTALWQIIGGAFSGPFIGVSLSLFALQHASIGVTSTLMALPPLFLLPVEYFYFKESPSWGAVAGTIVALIGVGILFLT
jgi:drug/metabolite transporter (DMT)-like permease